MDGYEDAPEINEEEAIAIEAQMAEEMDEAADEEAAEDYRKHTLIVNPRKHAAVVSSKSKRVHVNVRAANGVDGKEEKKEGEEAAPAVRERAGYPPGQYDIAQTQYRLSLRDLSRHRLERELETVYDFWGGNEEPDDFGEFCSRRFPSKRFDDLQTTRNVYMSRFLILLNALRGKGEIAHPSEVETQLHLILDRINLAYSARANTLRLSATFKQSYTNPEFSFFDHLAWRYQTTDEMTDHQQAMLVVYQRCEQMQLRHERDVVYMPVYNQEGVFVRCFEPIDPEIEHSMLLPFLSSLEMHPATSTDWHILNRAGATIRHLGENLQHVNNMSFPRLQQDRHFFSFENVRYNIAEDSATAYAEIKDDKVSCNYIAQEFELFDHLRGDFSTGAWFDIRKKCPNFMRLFETQLPKRSARAPNGYPAAQVENILRFMMAFTGRLFYDVGEKDNFQRMLVIVGESGVGKSIFIDTITAFYQRKNVGVLANDMQTSFGLEDVYNCFICTMSEMTDKCGLSQADMNNMVAGEGMMIRCKGKKCVQVPHFKPQLVTTANLFSKAFTDQRGNLERRLLACMWRTSVADKIPDLGKRILTELPIILVLCNRAYLSMIAQMQRDNVKNLERFWDPYFSQCLSLLFAETNPLTNFLDNGPLVFGPDLYMPMNELQHLFREHCKNANLHSPSFTEATYSMPFKRKNLTIETTRSGSTKVKRMYPREEIHQNPRYGVRKRRELIYVSGVDFNYQMDAAGDGDDMDTEEKEGGGRPGGNGDSSSGLSCLTEAGKSVYFGYDDYVQESKMGAPQLKKSLAETQAYITKLKHVLTNLQTHQVAEKAALVQQRISTLEMLCSPD